MNGSKGQERATGRKIFWFYAVPLILWMAFIFLMSSQPHEKQNLQPIIGERVPEEFVKENFSWVRFNYGDGEVSIRELGVPAFIEFFVRKAAHFAEYFILGCLAFRLLRVWMGNRRSVAWLLGVSALFCLFYAATDEFHQSFTPDRTPMAADVLLDAVSGCIGAAVYAAAARRGKARKNYS